MNHFSMRRVGVLAVLPVVLGGLAMGQGLDKIDRPGTVPTFSDPDKPADLVFEETMHDFGRISDEGDVEHIFKFTNTGTGTLYMSNLKGSCSCAVPALAKNEYAPGESGEVRVIFTPKKKAGSQVQTITVSSNDAETPSMVLNIRAFVRPEILIEPKIGHFGEVPKDQSAELTITVTGRKADFEVLGAEVSEPDLFSIKVGETEEVEIPLALDDPNMVNAPTNSEADTPVEIVRQCLITITMKPGQEIGLIRNKTLILTTNDEKRPSLTVELMAQHRGDLDMIPRRITLGSLNPGEEFHKEVTLKSLSGEPFKVLGIEHIAVAADALDYSFYPLDPANPTAYRIEVDGEMPADTRVLRGRFLVRTDLDREEELYLYYYAQVRPQIAKKPVAKPAAPTAPSDTDHGHDH